MKTSSGLALLAMVGVSVLLSGCTSNPVPAGEAATLPPKPSTEATIQHPPATADYMASGPIVVENQVELIAQRDGVVSEVFVETGAPVKKGQLLARLDDRQLRADREAAAAKLRSTEADLKNWEAGVKVAQAERDRSEQMWKANIVAKEQHERAKYRYDAAQFEAERQREDMKYAQETLRSLDFELEKTRITAPFDGLVARRYLRPGQGVAKNERLFWISAVSPLRVKFALPEAYLARVHKGTDLIVIASATPGEIHEARVVSVSPVVDPSSDTIDVTAELRGPSNGLRPGMTATIRLLDPK